MEPKPWKPMSTTGVKIAAFAEIQSILNALDPVDRDLACGLILQSGLIARRQQSPAGLEAVEKIINRLENLASSERNAVLSALEIHLSGAGRTIHAMHWRNARSELCRLSVDSFSRRVLVRVGGESFWVERGNLKDHNIRGALLSVFEDYLEAHHQTGDAGENNFSEVRVELGDGPLSFGELWQIIRASQVRQ